MTGQVDTATGRLPGDRSERWMGCSSDRRDAPPPAIAAMVDC
jgi:hypothetical protein